MLPVLTYDPKLGIKMPSHLPLSSHKIILSFISTFLPVPNPILRRTDGRLLFLKVDESHRRCEFYPPNPMLGNSACDLTHTPRLAPVQRGSAWVR